MNSKYKWENTDKSIFNQYFILFDSAIQIKTNYS